MDINGYPWTFMNIHGYQWTSMLSMDMHGLPVDIHGCISMVHQWISMEIHGGSCSSVGEAWRPLIKHSPLFWLCSLLLFPWRSCCSEQLIWMKGLPRKNMSYEDLPSYLITLQEVLRNGDGTLWLWSWSQSCGHFLGSSCSTVYMQTWVENSTSKTWNCGQLSNIVWHRQTFGERLNAFARLHLGFTQGRLRQHHRACGVEFDRFPNWDAHRCPQIFHRYSTKHRKQWVLWIS